MTERELFERYMNKTYPLAQLNKVYLNDDTYASLQIDNMWKAWQASASREGYKLVPVELIERCIIHIGIASCHPANNLNDDIQMSNDIVELEKAMIGAVE